MLSCSVHGMIVIMASLRWMILLVVVVGFVGRECEGNDLLLSPPSAMLCGGCATCQNPCASAPPPPVLPPPPPVLPPPPPPRPPACPPPPLALPPPPPASACDCPPTAGNGDGSPPAPYRYIFGGQPGSPGSPGSYPYYNYYNHASRPPVFLRFNLLISILPLLYWVLLNFLP